MTVNGGRPGKEAQTLSELSPKKTQGNKNMKEKASSRTRILQKKLPVAL